ncbi:MAG: DUF4974 domain-containing protein [Prevotellaceae bacterium]|nr:DUF4974 domain-containing protein [Prevotellaceae bacterium]
MKPNDNRYGDPALREALRKIQQEIDATPLPDGFEERVMNRIREENAAQPHPTARKTAFSTFRRVAAAVLVVAMVGSIAYAAFRMVGGSHTPSARHATNDSTPPAEALTAHGDAPVLFDNVPLDSIVTAVAQHYGRQVCFLNEGLCSLRLSTTWKKDASLAAFINTLNEFDGLQLTDERDTLFVTSTPTAEEEEAE